MDSFKSLVKIALFFTLFIFGFISINTVPYDFRSTSVFIYSSSGFGSGVIYKSNQKESLILTNAHVCYMTGMTKDEVTIRNDLEANMEHYCKNSGPSCLITKFLYNDYYNNLNLVSRLINVKFNNLQRNDSIGEIVRYDNNKDLCIVRIYVPNLIPAKLSMRSAVAGDKIFSIGNPQAITNHMTDGYVGDTLGTRQFHSGIVYPGNSGGGVFSQRGELVGLNVSYIQNYPSLNAMIPLSIIKDFLRE